MNSNRRLALALGVLVLLALLAFAGRARVAPTAVSPGDALEVMVTSADDLGPGSLREALFIAASASGRASVVIKARKVVLRTALPPLTNPHGVRIWAESPAGEIDAQAMPAGPVFDVAAGNTTLSGLVLSNCQGSAVLLRAAHFHLQSTTLRSCDVGLDVAANAEGVLVEQDHFEDDRIGIRFVVPNHDTTVTGNTFVRSREAGLWAVRGAPDGDATAITVRQNHFTRGRAGVVAGNIGLLVDNNDFVANAPDGALHLLGAGAVVRGNRIGGPADRGLVAENARQATIEGNTFSGFDNYAVTLRSSGDAQLRGNHIEGCGYGIAFVLGETGHPATATDNIIVAPRYHGIDVIGDSPVLRNNQVLQPQALALHVEDLRAADGQTVRSHPVLEGNNFLADSLQPVAAMAPARKGRASE